MNWAFGGVCVTVMAVADPSIPVYIQYGLLGPLLGVLWWAYRREAARGDRMEEKALQAVPKLTEATLALTESSGVLREVAELLRDMHRDAK